jgi:hypothetical protein
MATLVSRQSPYSQKNAVSRSAFGCGAVIKLAIGAVAAIKVAKVGLAVVAVAKKGAVAAACVGKLGGYALRSQSCCRGDSLCRPRLRDGCGRLVQSRTEIWQSFP